MKRFILGTILCLASLSVRSHPEVAPNAPEETKLTLGLTAGPVVKISQWGSGVMTSVGARVDAALFDVLLLGLGGHMAVAQSKLEIASQNEDVTYFYGALGIGARFFHTNPIHLTSYNNFGLGYLKLKTRGESGLALSIEPEINAEMDFFSSLRIGAGFSYRFLFANNIKVPSSQLYGLGGQIYVVYGWM